MRQTMLSPNEHHRLKLAVRNAMVDRGITASDAAAALGVPRRRIYAAIGEPFQPGLLVRLGQYLGVWPVRP